VGLAVGVAGAATVVVVVVVVASAAWADIEKDRSKVDTRRQFCVKIFFMGSVRQIN
jgi:hypothetical protein